MRHWAYAFLIALVGFVLNVAVLFWSYQRTTVPYLIEPQLTENVPRMFESVVLVALAAFLTAVVAALLLRPVRRADRD